MSRTDLLDPARLGEDQIAAWQKLADTAIEPNPFYEPSFVLPAIEAREASARRLRLLVVRDEGDERWLACLPVVKRRYGRLLPVWEAWNGPYVFLTTPLLAGQSPGRLVAALIEGLPRRITGKALTLACHPDEGLAEIALHSGLLEIGWTPAARSRFDRAYLTRRDDEGDYTAAISSHHRREANRRARRLADEVGTEPVFEARGGDPAAVEAFLKLEASGWKGEAGTSMAADPADAAFFRGMCAAFDQLGRIDILILRAGETDLAAECILTTTEGCFTFKIAHEDRFARFSPGIAMVLSQIGWFHRRGLFWADSCADPDNRMINRLWPDRRRLQAIVLIEPGRRGAPARALLRLIGRLKKA